MIDNSKMKLAAARNVCPGSWMFRNSWVIRGPPRTAGLRDCGMGIFPNFPETFGESVQSIIFSSHKCCWSCKLVLWRYARYACRAQVVLNLLETSWTSPNILHVPPLFLHVSSFPQELLTEFAEKTLKEGKVIPGTLAEKTWPQCRSTERGTGRIPKKKNKTQQELMLWVSGVSWFVTVETVYRSL